MLVLSGDDLMKLFRPAELIEAVESAARAQDENQVIVPTRLRVDWSGNSLLTMPAVASKASAVKIVSVIPSNAARGLPVINGLVVLNDGETGVPLAAMNASVLTALRTGAVGALGVKYQTPQDIPSVGIIGCGVQGAWQAIFACALRPIRTVLVTSRSAARFEAFCATVGRHAPGARVAWCENARELLEQTNLIITATTTNEPVLPDDARLLRGKHFISVGSYKPDMQELPDSVYRLAGELAVDTPDARHEAGDVINPLQRGIIESSDIFPIGECVRGVRTIDTAATTAYKTVGTAIYDLFAAERLYRAARAQRIGQEITI
jgi:ornithine cyclodeaminase/alanine dehydrogenase-like protein (mu-crystallin family)